MKIALLLLLLTLTGARLPLEAAPEPASAAASKPLDYRIIVTGGELLEGAYPDAHTHFLTRTFRPLGGRCVGSITVDDEPHDIQRALRFATNQVSLIIVTGGLGPTPNDITRETLAEFTGISLREDPDVLADMEKRFNQTREQLRSTLRRQTLVPSRGGFLNNSAGTAVGLIFDTGTSWIVALPGPPRELQPMVKNELVPALQRRFGIRSFGASLTLRFVGAGQSLIAQTIKDHIVVAPDVTVTSLFDGSRVDFTFTLPGHAPEDQARLQKLEGAIREHLNEYLYADDGSSLEQVVVNKLRARGGSLALVEVGSAGNLAAALGQVEAIGEFLAGAFVAPTEAALARLLGPPGFQSAQSGSDNIRALASAAARQTQSQWAIGVGAVETTASGEKAVWLAIKFPDDRLETQRVTIRGSPEVQRANLTTQILDQLRRRLK